MASNQGGIAAYVTSHGYGHINRVVAVLNQIPTEVPIVVRGAPELRPAFEERLLRHGRFESAAWDRGVINPDGDSASTDAKASVIEAQRTLERVKRKLPDEVRRLRAEGTACVLSDAAAAPLAAAREAGIPGYLLANFLWSEIFEEYSEPVGPAARSLADQLIELYRCAAVVLRAQPGLPLQPLERCLNVGMVTNQAEDLRDELRESIGAAPNEKLVSLYVGQKGQLDLAWDRLELLQGVQFVGFQPPPIAGIKNYHVVEAGSNIGKNLAASVDASIAKAGYGSVTNAMSHGIPLVYPPREGFAEFRALDRALRDWGGGIPLTAEEYRTMDLHKALQTAFTLRVPAPPLPTNGAFLVAAMLMGHCRF